MLKQYSKFCYENVGSYVLDYLDYFDGLNENLSKADIGLTLPEYVSMMFFSTFASSLLIFLSFGILYTLLRGFTGILLGIMYSLIFTPLVGISTYYYPTIKMKNRASKIRDKLPFAVMYLRTMSGTGTTMPEIFEELSKVEEYGEVSREAEKISRDINSFGMDIEEALEKAAERTPSDDFKELVDGLRNSLKTKGSVEDFLNERSKTLMENYQRRLEEYSDTVSLMTQVYITLVMIGSVIFTSMTSVISTFSSSLSPNLLVFVQVTFILGGLPLISGMFIVLIDGISPGGLN